MSKLNRNETAIWLQDRNDFLILTHRRPDGDTIGSAVALCLGLRQLGKTAFILDNPDVTEKYAALQEGLLCDAPQAHHTLIAVDVASPGLLPESFLPLLPRISLRIDHHFSATSFTPDEMVDHTAGACGDIIYDVLTLMGATLDVPLAEALYVAVSTDTGCFRYANTNAHSYLVAAACAQTGADLHALSQLIFETNSLAKLKLQSWMVEHMELLANGAVAVCTLPLAVEKNLGVTEDDMENISGFPRTIEGVKIAATLRELPGGKIKLSVRALPGHDASAICAVFGGGGHKGAAGANLEMPLAQAASTVAGVILDRL